jgi:hypothetical protein
MMPSLICEVRGCSRYRGIPVPVPVPVPASPSLPLPSLPLAMDKTLALQMQIRQNAEEVASALREVQGWQKVVQKKDQALRKKAPVQVRVKDGAVRSAVGTVSIRNSEGSSSSSKPRQQGVIVDIVDIVEIVVSTHTHSFVIMCFHR